MNIWQIVALALCIVMVLAIDYISHKIGYDEGVEKGYQDGYRQGLRAGWEEREYFYEWEQEEK